MKKTLLIAFISFITTTSFAQDAVYKKTPTLAVNFMLNDFQTASRIRNGSLQGVFREKSWAKFSEMAPGLSLQYLQGLSNHVDFMASLGGSFARFNYKDQQTTSTNSSNTFLLEADANVMVKLLSDHYRVTPYFTVGAGASSYKSSYGAYIPTGIGVQIKLSEESFLFTNMQYRIGITEKTNHHFNYSIGFGAPLFGKNSD